MIKTLPGVFPSFEVVTIFDVELVVVPVIFDIGVPWVSKSKIDTVFESTLECVAFDEDVVSNTSIVDDDFGVSEIVGGTVSPFPDSGSEVSVDCDGVGFDSKLAVLVVALEDCVADSDALVVVFMARNFT